MGLLSTVSLVLIVLIPVSGPFRVPGLADREMIPKEGPESRSALPKQEKSPKEDPETRSALQREILEEYLDQRSKKDAVLKQVKRKYRNPFEKFSEKDYTRFMEDLDLNRGDDLWTWSHATGITIAALSKKSIFFYCNAHLIEDLEAADAMPLADVAKIRSSYDRESDTLILTGPEGKSLPIRDLPEGTIRLTGRTGRFSYDADFAEPRTVLEVLEPYLVRLGDVPHRKDVAVGLRALPLSVVKLYRGKAIYLTTQPGRSYAIGMPVGNAGYKLFAGMQTGYFLDYMRRSANCIHNLIHELGHIIDYTVISGHYGRYLFPYQFPEFQALKEERERVFGKGDDKVPQTDHGCISRYAKTNAQESFAEHFTAYILKKADFRGRAEKEQAEGNPQLMEKYRFMEKLLENTPVNTHRLSKKYLKYLNKMDDGK